MGNDNELYNPHQGRNSEIESATMWKEEISMEAVGKATTVPSNAYAQLMYYLGIMKSLVPAFDLPSELVDYSRYYNLTSDQKKIVLLLSVIFTPEEILNKLIFVVENGSPLLNGSANEIYKISNATSFLHVQKDLIIDGKVIEIVQIMVCTENWVRSYWINPILSLKDELERILNEEKEPNRQQSFKRAASYRNPTPTYRSNPTPTYNSSRYSSSSSSSKSGSNVGICCICLTVILMLFLISFCSFTIFSYNNSVRCFICPGTLDNKTCCDNSTISWDASKCVSGCETTYEGDPEVIIYSYVCFGFAGAMLCFLYCSCLFLGFAEDKTWGKVAAGTLWAPLCVIFFLMLAIGFKYQSYAPYVAGENC